MSSSPVKLGKLVEFLERAKSWHENNPILSGHIFEKYTDDSYSRKEVITAVNNVQQSVKHFRKVCNDLDIDVDFLLGDVPMDIDPDRIPDEPK